MDEIRLTENREQEQMGQSGTASAEIA